MEINRFSRSIKEWLPLSSAAVAITFIIAFIMHVPLQQTIAASVVAGIMVFSGLLFRSFGKDKEKY